MVKEQSIAIHRETLWVAASFNNKCFNLLTDYLASFACIICGGLKRIMETRKVSLLKIFA